MQSGLEVVCALSLAAGPHEDADRRLCLTGYKNPPNAKISESLDYEPVQNKVFYDRMKSRASIESRKKIWGYTGATFTKMLITIATGIVTGLCAVTMSRSVSGLTHWRNEVIQGIIDEPSGDRVLKAFGYAILFSSTLVTVATALVSRRGSRLMRAARKARARDRGGGSSCARAAPPSAVRCTRLFPPSARSRALPTCD